MLPFCWTGPRSTSTRFLPYAVSSCCSSASCRVAEPALDRDDVAIVHRAAPAACRRTISFWYSILLRGTICVLTPPALDVYRCILPHAGRVGVTTARSSAGRRSDDHLTPPTLAFAGGVMPTAFTRCIAHRSSRVPRLPAHLPPLHRDEPQPKLVGPGGRHPYAGGRVCLPIFLRPSDSGAPSISHCSPLALCSATPVPRPYCFPAGRSPDSWFNSAPPGCHRFMLRACNTHHMRALQLRLSHFLQHTVPAPWLARVFRRRLPSASAYLLPRWRVTFFAPRAATPAQHGMGAGYACACLHCAPHTPRHVLYWHPPACSQRHLFQAKNSRTDGCLCQRTRVARLRHARLTWRSIPSYYTPYA